jgi:hypothetical protein
MQVADNLCAILVLIAFLVHGLIGLVIEYAVAKEAHDTVESVTPPRKSKLERLKWLWERSSIPVWLGSIGLIWFLC